MMDNPLVPNNPDGTVHLVLSDFGPFACACVETNPTKAELETIISDLINGEFGTPARVIAFNVAEGWSRDVSRDIADKIRRRTEGQQRSLAMRRFIDRHLAVGAVP